MDSFEKIAKMFDEFNYRTFIKRVVKFFKFLWFGTYKFFKDLIACCFDSTRNPIVRIIAASILLLMFFVAIYGYTVYLSIRPNVRDANIITYDESVDVVGYRSVHALSQIGTVILDKPGGFIYNDVFPPFSFMDDMPNFEMGVVQVIRNALVVYRNHFSRNQTQSMENPHVVEAFTRFNIDTRSWMFPAAESEYRKGIEALERYEALLISPQDDGSEDNFYTRATSLADLLTVLNKLVGSQTQALGNAVADNNSSHTVPNIDLAGDPNGTSARDMPKRVASQTPSDKIDDVFWQSAGVGWATLEILKAVRVDFASVLEDKNAMPTLDQIIEQLEASQQAHRWPWVANGTGFSGFANHSLTLKAYMAQASQSFGDLITLLRDG